MKNTITGLFILFMLSTSVSEMTGQGLVFGIRAGLNFSTFLGPDTEEEKHGLNNGFHFGIDVGYKLSDIIFLRGEILYLQKGSSYDYSGESFYIFNLPTDNRFVLQDSSKITLDISNAYISFPMTIHFSALEKWEFHGGAYVSFLISPVGAGTWTFGSRDAVNYQFKQGLNYDYDGDVPGESSPFAEQILLLVEDQTTSVPSLVGAYYLLPEDRGSLINKVDYGLTGGVSYFLNKGLYLGIKGWYGLRDVTNNAADYSYKNLTPEGNFIYSDDYDRNFNIDLSLGFKF